MTLLILVGIGVTASMLAYRAVHAWRAPMPATHVALAYRPLGAPIPVPHVEVDADPTFSHRAAVAAVEHGAPVIMSKRERADAERVAVLALVAPLYVALDDALTNFRAAMAEPMSIVERWLAEAKGSDELALWRTKTPTAEFPIVVPA